MLYYTFVLIKTSNTFLLLCYVEYEFCNAISDSVPDLTIATKGFPAKSVTNPSCSCDFESEDAEVFALTGYAHCNVSNTV